MTKRYKILLVEDDIIDRMAFERFVRTQELPYDYMVAVSAAEARRLLAEHQFDIALFDYGLGEDTGLDLFADAAHIPIIVITGSNELEIVVEVMKAGAFDFIAKDPQGSYLTALPIKIENTIERWLAEQELVQYRTRLEELVEERTAAWQKEQARLQTVVETTPTIVFSLDQDANFTFIAGNTQEILAVSSNEVIGRSLFSLFPDLSAVYPIFQKLSSAETISTDVQRNGRWLSLNMVRQQTEQDQITLLGVLYDITERKQAELEVLREHNLLRTLIDNIPDYIFVKDQNGRFIETNVAHAAGAGISREEVLNHTAKDLFDPELAEQFHADDYEVLQNGRTIQNKERITTGPNGERRWVLTTKVPLYDDAQNVIGLVGISRDITDRRQAEVERLKTERLRLELERERELVEMKQRFISTASHDFRTPLTIINLHTGMLLQVFEHLTPKKRREKLHEIQVQADHMTDLLDDVLILSKLNADRVTPSLTQFELKSFCDRLWEDMLLIDQDKHQGEFHYLADVQQITADEQLLQHALINLLTNAFKYTAEGGQVKFEVRNNEQELLFEVSDQGYGIPQEDMKQLFQPFHRARNVKNIEGTGLGLAIVKEYIELHQGSIMVASKEGVGTTFIVQLPL